MRTSRYLRRFFCAILVLAMLLPANVALAVKPPPVTDLQLLSIKSSKNTTPGTPKIERYEDHI